MTMNPGTYDKREPMSALGRSLGRHLTFLSHAGSRASSWHRLWLTQRGLRFRGRVGWDKLANNLPVFRFDILVLVFDLVSSVTLIRHADQPAL